MNRKLKNILVILIPVAIILLIVLGSFLGQRARAIPANPSDLAGSSAGNLYNGGTFCEYGGMVYFANPYDGGSIYSMKSDGSDIRKVVAANASFINVAGDHIYYYSSSGAGQSGLGYIRDGRGIYRTDKAGRHNIILSNITSNGLMLLGNSLIYSKLDSDSSKDAKEVLNCMDLSGKNEKLLVNDQIKPGCAYGTMVFYAGMTKDHYLYSADPGSGSITRVMEINMYEPSIADGYVYYLDMSDNMSLKRTALSDTSDTITLSPGRIETFNLAGEYVYYQTIDESGGGGYAFKRIRTDGSAEELIKEGVVKDIQVTSSYVYFRDFNADMPIYRLPAYGSGNIEVFDAAAAAVKTP